MHSTQHTAALLAVPLVVLTAKCRGSADVNAKKDAELAEKDEKIAALLKEVATLKISNLKPGHCLLGICTLGDGRVTELFKGPQGGLYYLSPSEQRMSVASNDERIEFMDPEDVETRLQAAAEPKVVGLWTSNDKTKVRAVFQGPKGGIYYPTPRGRVALTDGDYVKMDKADVFARIAAYEAFMASQGKDEDTEQLQRVWDAPQGKPTK